jgi:hypothetical protein
MHKALGFIPSTGGGGKRKRKKKKEYRTKNTKE